MLPSKQIPVMNLSVLPVVDEHSVNIGVNVPVGVGYANAGYKRGEVYDVEVTRLTDDPV